MSENPGYYFRTAVFLPCLGSSVAVLVVVLALTPIAATFFSLSLSVSVFRFCGYFPCGVALGNSGLVSLSLAWE
jgi:hypothetical protein